MDHFFIKCATSFYNRRKNYSEKLCSLTTVLPQGHEDILPEDTKPLRYAVRTDGKSGFVFINNYQDHAKNVDQKNETIRLQLKEEEIKIEGVGIKAGYSAILPFNLDLEGLRLRYATLQPLSVLHKTDETVYIFFRIPGMDAKYQFEDDVITETQEDIILTSEHGKVRIVTLDYEQALNYYEIQMGGRKTGILSEQALIQDGEKLYFETVEEMDFKTPVKECGSGRYTIQVPEMDEWKDVYMTLTYAGDVGHIFNSAGKLLNDDFSNGYPWENGLKELGVASNDVLTFYITPKRESVKIDVSSTMAGRMDRSDQANAKLYDVTFRGVRREEINIADLAAPADEIAWESGLLVF